MGINMYTREEFLEGMKNRLESNFNFISNKKINGSTFDLVAVYQEVSGRTFVSKVDIIDRLEKYERMHLVYEKRVNAEVLEDHALSMKVWANNYMPKNKDHMSTVLTVVVYTDKITEEAKKWLKKFKYTKYYFMAIRGWCDLRFAVVELPTNSIYTCKKARIIRNVFDLSFKQQPKKQTNKLVDTIGKLFH